MAIRTLASRRMRLATVVVSVLAASSASAASKKEPEIPTCDKKLGTLAVAEPENKWWTALNL